MQSPPLWASTFRTEETDMKVKTVCIVGLGLIGGSLAEIPKSEDAGATIYAIDSNSESVGQAMGDKIITEGIDFGSLCLGKRHRFCLHPRQGGGVHENIVPKVKPAASFAMPPAPKGRLSGG